jgi:hypothetical protein
MNYEKGANTDGDEIIPIIEEVEGEEGQTINAGNDPIANDSGNDPEESHEEGEREKLLKKRHSLWSHAQEHEELSPRLPLSN